MRRAGLGLWRRRSGAARCSACCLSFLAGASAMPSYLADWLFWSSLPFGALPVVMLLDLAGTGCRLRLEPALRRLLMLTPVAGLLLIPRAAAPGGAVRLGQRTRLHHARSARAG